MASLNINFTESPDVIHKDIAAIKISDIIVLREHIVEVIETAHTASKRRQYYIVGKDIFTDRRYEEVLEGGQMIRMPHLNKKDYLLISIEDDGFVTLLDEETCDTRSDLKLKKNSNLGRQLSDKYNEGNEQIKITVLKVLNEEHMIEFKIED